MKIKSTKNLGNMVLSVLLRVWIRSPGANMHLRSLSLIFLRRYPEMSAVGARSRWRMLEEREKP